MCQFSDGSCNRRPNSELALLALGEKLLFQQTQTKKLFVKIFTMHAAMARGGPYRVASMPFYFVEILELLQKTETIGFTYHHVGVLRALQSLGLDNCFLKFQMC